MIQYFKKGGPQRNQNWGFQFRGTDENGNTAYAVGEDPETGYINYFVNENGAPVWK